MEKYKKISILLAFCLVVVLALFLSFVIYSNNRTSPDESNKARVSPTLKTFPTNSPTPTHEEKAVENSEFNKPEGMSQEFFEKVVIAINNTKNLDSFEYTNEVSTYEDTITEKGKVDNVAKKIFIDEFCSSFANCDDENSKYVEFVVNRDFTRKYMNPAVESEYNKLDKYPMFSDQKPSIVHDFTYLAAFDYLKVLLSLDNGEHTFSYGYSPDSLARIVISDLKYTVDDTTNTYSIAGIASYYDKEGLQHSYGGENIPFELNIIINEDGIIDSISTPYFAPMAGDGFGIRDMELNFANQNKEIIFPSEYFKD